MQENLIVTKKVNPDRAEWIFRAEAVGRLAEAEAAEAERNSRLSDRMGHAIEEAEFNKLLRPKRFGGPSIDFGTYKDILRTVARHSIAAGWITYFAGIHEQWVAYLPPKGREEIYAQGMVGDVFTPNGRVEKDGDEYILSGHWGFASGCVHSKWMGLGAMMELPDSDGPELCILTLPMSDCKIVETWDSMGIRGSGSHDIVVDGARVPLHRILPLTRLQAGLPPNGGDYDADDPMYRTPYRPLFGFGFSCLALGGAERIVSLFQEQTERRSSWYKGGAKAIHSSSNQRVMGELKMELYKMEGLVDRYIRHLENWQTEAKIALSMEERAQIFALRGQVAKSAADIAVKALLTLGSSAVLKGNPVELFTRDILTLSTHLSQRYEESLIAYGTVIFGLPSDASF